MSFSGSGASVADLDAVLRQPGRWVAAPSNLSAAFPYGGTYLGACGNGCIIDLDDPVFPLVCSEEAGRRPYNDLFVGFGDIEAIVEIRECDNDTLQVAFPSMTTAGASTQRKIQFPGSISPGTLLSTEAMTMLYVPFNTTEHKAALFRQVHPFVVESLSLRNQAETLLTVAFRVREKTAHGTAAENMFVVGKLSDLAL